jgi:uncharacterized protein
MNPPFAYKIQNQNCWLTAERGIYWEQTSSLIVSDLHFGKTGHFRKNGIAIPQDIYQADLQRLVNLIRVFKPKKLIVVGDLFHSSKNLELNQFSRMRNSIADIEMILVAGNHDILEPNWYQENGIFLFEKKYQLNHFHFVHDPSDIDSNLQEAYFFAGHLHPSVSIKNNAKQRLNFPCFYFTKAMGILPAFSKFSGTAKVTKTKNNQIFAIVEDSLIEIN